MAGAERPSSRYEEALPRRGDGDGGPLQYIGLQRRHPRIRQHSVPPRRMEAHNLRLAGRDGPDRRCGRRGGHRHGARVRLRARKEGLWVPERVGGWGVRRSTVEQRSMQDLFSLAGKVAVVTGATGVLGSEMARSLARSDARVALLGRREKKANRVAG